MPAGVDLGDRIAASRCRAGVSASRAISPATTAIVVNGEPSSWAAPAASVPRRSSAASFSSRRAASCSSRSCVRKSATMRPTNQADTAAVSVKLTHRPSVTRECGKRFARQIVQRRRERVGEAEGRDDEQRAGGGKPDRQQQRDQDDMQQVEQRERIRGAAGEYQQQRVRREIERKVRGDLGMRGRRAAPQAHCHVTFHRHFGSDDEHHRIERKRDLECPRERNRDSLARNRKPAQPKQPPQARNQRRRILVDADRRLHGMPGARDRARGRGKRRAGFSHVRGGCGKMPRSDSGTPGAPPSLIRVKRSPTPAGRRQQKSRRAPAFLFAHLHAVRAKAPI